MLYLRNPQNISWTRDKINEEFGKDIKLIRFYEQIIIAFLALLPFIAFIYIELQVGTLDYYSFYADDAILYLVNYTFISIIIVVCVHIFLKYMVHRLERITSLKMDKMNQADNLVKSINQLCLQNHNNLDDQTILKLTEQLRGLDLILSILDPTWLTIEDYSSERIRNFMVEMNEKKFIREKAKNILSEIL